MLQIDSFHDNNLKKAFTFQRACKIATSATKRYDKATKQLRQKVVEKGYTSVKLFEIKKEDNVVEKNK